MRLRFIVPALAAPAAVIMAAGTLTVAEKKAVRREMIEMDIAVRNLTSIIATGAKNGMIADSLDRLVLWRVKDHPEHGKNFASALGRWEKQGVLKFGKLLQQEASSLRNYVNAQGTTLSDAGWARVSSGLTRILSACQGCHAVTLKENQP